VELTGLLGSPLALMLKEKSAERVQV